MKRAIVVIAVAALLLTVGAFAIPRPAAAQVFGGYADSLVFSVVPQAQAVASVSSGDQDWYIFQLDTATDKQAARDDPNINVKESFSGFRGMIVNPVAPSDGSFNPFTIREIREAQHWAYDREFVLAEIAGGFGIPMSTAHFGAEPNFVRDAAFFTALETEYAFDPARAKAQVDDAMSRVQGASFDAATNKWLMNGAEIQVIVVQRVEDFRFEIGAYVAQQIADWGFTTVLDPSTFIEALTKVYFSDSKLGQWHMYTEGWGSSGFVQFDDGQAPFFYNRDFGSAMWDDYNPPATLDVACSTLENGDYVTLDERRDLLRTCMSEGMRDGIRSFILADADVYAQNVALSNTAFNIFAGNLQPFAVRTTMKNAAVGGTLKIAQPIHTGSAWNHYGGFGDVYSVYQQFSIQDFGVANHPHLGTFIPMRADFVINSVGPLGAHDVPTSALTFDTVNNTFVNVSAGVTSKAFVDFTFKFGEWHHGGLQTMADVVMEIATHSRMASGDFSVIHTSNAAQSGFRAWDASFKGFSILGPDSMRVYYDFFNPDETLTANGASPWPHYPWELVTLIMESGLAGETAPHDTDADVKGIQELDLAKGGTFALLDPRLAANMAANTIPAFLSNMVTPAEATARWAALDAWRNQVGCTDGPAIWNCNYMVSDGPYFLDEYFTQPEGALYTAKRTGYPLEVTSWDRFATIRAPSVVLGAVPEVIQTFPATFQFTTTLAGAPYDRIAQAGWLLSDPATKRILFSGDATRTGIGTFSIELTADQTTALVAGTYELQTIVVGEEAALPVVATQSFTSLSLSSAILADLQVVLNTALADFQTTLDDNTAATQAAVDSASAATNLANLVLIVAIVAVVIAAAAIAALLIVWRRIPPT